MKEGYPREELTQQKIERVVSHFGCEPCSIKTLRHPQAGKFFIILEAEKEGESKTIKATTDRRNAARLRIESNVLSSVPRDYLSQNGVVLPEIERELTQFEDLSVIMISKVPEGQKPSFPDFCHVLEVFRKMEIPEGLRIERVEPSDYLKKTLTRLRFLRKIGALKGLSGDEVERIQRFYLKNWESLALFDRVFVHGDFKEKHVRRINEKLGVIDFDKSVIGCELEDPAWLSVRHPNLGPEIKKYLRERFRTSKGKSKYFDEAFRLMQIDRLVEGYFTRTYQWRGNLDAFSYISKTWGRITLNILLKN